MDLTADETKHLRARRLDTGELIGICDGKGSVAKAVLETFDAGRHKQWLCRPDYQSTTYTDRPDRIVFSALPKGSRFDVLAEKATELGMTRFIPVEFERSVRESYSVQRAERLSQQAAGQSQRLHLPVFEPMISFDELLDRSTSFHQADTIRFYLLDQSGGTVADLLARSPSKTGTATDLKPALAIVVGPEGGFTDIEKVALLEKGVIAVSLSDGILRIETAVVSGLVFLNLLQN